MTEDEKLAAFCASVANVPFPSFDVGSHDSVVCVKVSIDPDTGDIVQRLVPRNEWQADRYTEQQKAADDRWLQLMGSFQRIDDKWLDMIDDEMSHLPSSPYFTDESKSQ